MLAQAGPEELDTLKSFLASVSSSSPPSLLGKRPPALVPKSKPRRRNVIPEDFIPWRSPRLQLQGDGARRHTISKAQKVTMKKLGIIEEEEENIPWETMQHYTVVFDQQLSDQQVQTLAELLDVTVNVQDGLPPDEVVAGPVPPLSTSPA